MGSDSPPPQQTTVSTSEPAAFIQPFLGEAAEESQRLFAQPTPEFFPGTTVVPFAPETEEALTGISARARAGSPLVRGAQQTALETIQGRGVSQFLAPAVQAATAPLFERFQEQTLPGLRSAFAGLGRTGSGAEERALQQASRELGRGVSEQSARLAFGSAEAEAQRQFQALQLAPGLAAQDFTGLQQLAGVGGIREQQAGLSLQEQIDRFNFAQSAEGIQLNELIARLGILGGGGGTVTTSEPGGARQPSRFSSVLGGGVSGAASGAILGSIVPGFGTGIGAATGFGLGATAGLFR